MARKCQHPRGRQASWLAVIAAMTILRTARSEAFHTMRSGVPVHGLAEIAGASHGLATFADVVALVRRHGLLADLGRLCRAFGLHQLPSSCRFKQVAVDPSPDSPEHHGFNVPLQSMEAPPYVLIFHLHPLIGEFFVVSPRGELVAARFRAKGVDYTPISNDEARQAFESEVSFWRRNVSGLKQQLEGDRQPAPGKGVEP